MQRRSRYTREETHITEEYVEAFIKPRITAKQREILRFIWIHRLATSTQVAEYFYWDKVKAQDLTNRQLRTLYDLHCIDRWFPPVDKGSSLQHVSLGLAGAKILGVNNRRMKALPLTYRHMVLVTEYRMRARLNGFGWGESETKLGAVQADIWYPEHKLAVEVDTGTETTETLLSKAQRYQSLLGVKWVVFCTTGKGERAKRFLSSLPQKKAWTHISDLPKFLVQLQTQL